MIFFYLVVPFREEKILKIDENILIKCISYGKSESVLETYGDLSRVFLLFASTTK